MLILKIMIVWLVIGFTAVVIMASRDINNLKADMQELFLDNAKLHELLDAKEEDDLK